MTEKANPTAISSAKKALVFELINSVQTISKNYFNHDTVKI